MARPKAKLVTFGSQVIVLLTTSRRHYRLTCRVCRAQWKPPLLPADEDGEVVVDLVVRGHLFSEAHAQAARAKGERAKATAPWLGTASQPR